MLRRVLLGLLLVVLLGGGFLWWRVYRLDAEEVRPGLWMLTGVGGNVGVLVTNEGVVVVDTMTFVRQGEKILERIAKITDQRVMAVLNTHYHLDHTHGNPAFLPGTRVLATTRTLQHLRERDADFWRDEPARRLLPNTTFETTQEIALGGRTVRLLHPGRGHTDGDLVVLFVEDRVLQAGDLFSNGVYPNIDLEAGGTVREWGDTLDRVLALDFDTVIPGHGPISDRAGLVRFQTFIRSLWTQTSAIATRGGSRDEALSAVDLASFGLRPLWFAPYLNRRFVIRRAYEEATGTAG
ncbi:MAG TPA: MBL fold metallo-hydrolase [Candidatus Binatia bacterium]|nr:MBL fold metallo-hydrolase [Candidatus Binatia bacterium]